MTHNPRFSILQGRAVKDRRISDAQLRTLAALGTFTDEEGWCFPALGTIGADLKKSKQAVGRDIIALKQLGYIEVYPRYDDKGGRRSNRYRLVFDPPIAHVDAPPSSQYGASSTPDVDDKVPTEGSQKKRKDILDGMQHFALQAKANGEDEVEALLVRLERGLYLNLPRGAQEQSVAKWILKKEGVGESLDDWLKWLKSDDWRKTHLNLYRHVSRIKTEWPQAFVKKEQSNDTSRIVDGVDEGKYV